MLKRLGASILALLIADITPHWQTRNIAMTVQLIQIKLRGKPRGFRQEYLTDLKRGLVYAKKRG